MGSLGPAADRRPVGRVRRFGRPAQGQGRRNNSIANNSQHNLMLFCEIVMVATTWRGWKLASMQPSNAQVTWEGAVLAQLERHKRYPRAAQRRSQEGVPSVIIRINRQGKVLSVRLSHSSGFAMLDEEATALPERASPLPPPPPAEMAGDPFEFTVPVHFFLN